MPEQIAVVDDHVRLGCAELFPDAEAARSAVFDPGGADTTAIGDRSPADAQRRPHLRAFRAFRDPHPHIART